MTEQSKPTERGAAEYERRHPTQTHQQDGDTQTGSASGRAAYARRHGNRPGRND